MEVLFVTTAVVSATLAIAFLLRYEPAGAIVLNCADAYNEREMNIVIRMVFIEGAKIQPKSDITECHAEV